ncbi:MAG: glycosyltransferase [Gemmatimonadetes bacterium]|nr:glycosyltransferase [Gemmatimonadota bacterium]
MVWPDSLIRQIRSIAPDVVHMHSGVWYKASLAARRAGVPRLIYTEHGRQRPPTWEERIFDGLAARGTDVVAAVSEAVAHQLSGTLVREPEKLRVVLNGVDTERFRPAPDTGLLRAELRVPPETPILGSIGRLEHIKGYDVMVRAFVELRSHGHEGGKGVGAPPVLVLAGDGSERPRLEALARELGVEESMYLLGWRDDVHDLHSAFTLFTMASRSEGTSVSLLEAMSAGLCPVITEVGGNAAVLGPDLRHRLVPPEDASALASAWRAALTASRAREADARAARERVKEHFGLQAMVARYQELYLGAG